MTKSTKLAKRKPLSARRQTSPAVTPSRRSLKPRTKPLKAPRNLGFRSIFGSRGLDLVLGALILTIYLGIRFGFTQNLDALGAYASMVFEVLLVSMAALIYRDRIRLNLSLGRELALGFVPAFAMGAGFMGLTRPLGLHVPFDLASAGSIALLVLIGPVLEEFVFRMMLWNPLLDFGRRVRGEGEIFAAVGTSILFAYAHFHVVWFLPAGDVRSFVLYQTFYVLFLSALCAYRLVRSGSLAAPILVHVGFNLGFYLATFI